MGYYMNMNAAGDVVTISGRIGTVLNTFARSGNTWSHVTQVAQGFGLFTTTSDLSKGAGIYGTGSGKDFHVALWDRNITTNAWDNTADIPLRTGVVTQEPYIENNTLVVFENSNDPIFDNTVIYRFDGSNWNLTQEFGELKQHCTITGDTLVFGVTGGAEVYILNAETDLWELETSLPAPTEISQETPGGATGFQISKDETTIAVPYPNTGYTPPPPQDSNEKIGVVVIYRKRT